MSSAGGIRKIREGFTLIELLVVVSIIMLLTVVAMPALGPSREGRRLREAARSIHSYFGSARAAAMASGHNVGVMLERQQDANGATFSRACLTLYQVEQPPLYAGEVDGATVQVRSVRTINTGGTVLYDGDGNELWRTILFRPTVVGTLDYTQLRVGDLVQFNNQGPLYRLTGPSDANGAILTSSTELAATMNDSAMSYYFYSSQAMLGLPWPKTDLTLSNPTIYSQPVSYVFYRQPMRSSATPMELPTAVAIDLQFSGNDSHYAATEADEASTPISFAPGWTTGTGTGRNARGDPLPVYIMFAPNGSVQEVYATSPATNSLTVYSPTEPLYLLVGDRGRIKGNFDASTLPVTPAEDEYPNWYRLASLWLVLAPQSGLMRVAENHPVDITNRTIVGNNFAWSDANWYSVATATNLNTSAWRMGILQARSFARGSYYNASGVLTPLAQGADDTVGGR